MVSEKESVTTSEKQEEAVAKQDESMVASDDTVSFNIDKGADIVIIYEDKGNFVPLFLFSCEQVRFDQSSSS